jgi:pimeloyl-ACP methyl ester carboxylesterase
LHKRWLEDFDWPIVQTHLNRHPHFLSDVEHDGHELRIHFTHTRSTRPDAIPIILIHGWPGSFYEFDRIVDDLANPQNDTDPAFHVIVPSLPGFCWSSPPPKRGWTMKDNAAVLNKLMLQLSYTSYVVQAGDWGSFVARELGAQYPECKAVHLNFCPVEISADEKDLTPREMQVKARYQDWMDEHLGYAVCMRSRPQTISIALADNPVGILSWVGEKFVEAAAPSKLEDSDWDQSILITASLYYFSDCIMTSMLPYYENVQHAGFGHYFLAKENYIGVPMGYTSFLYDTRPGTSRTAKLTGNLVFYEGELCRFYVTPVLSLTMDNGSDPLQNAMKVAISLLSSGLMLSCRIVARSSGSGTNRRLTRINAFWGGRENYVIKDQVRWVNRDMPVLFEGLSISPK